MEFQKHGLPHAHILLFLHPTDKPSMPSDIDKIISAELPNKVKDPVAFESAVQFMIHGPCSKLDENSPCRIHGSCSKHFPKKFNNQTVIDDDGFPVYRRRKNLRIVEINDIVVDNQWVIPYNRDLIVKYDAHINIEYCNQTRAVKYLFRYVNKESDRTTIVIENNSPTVDSTSKQVIREVDEIKTYLDCRYVSASEACWRIFDFEIQFHYPSVERLSFHLPNEQPVVFDDSDDLSELQTRNDLDVSIFTRWMETNALYADARELTYIEFPTKWTWHSNEKFWARRGGREREGRIRKVEKIGRLYYTQPTLGEKIYLRMLLNIVKGPTKYEDIRTVNGVTFPDFKSACSALGLLEDDNEP